MHVTVNGTDQTELLREMGSLVLTADGDAVQIDGNTAPHLAAARIAELETTLRKIRELSLAAQAEIDSSSETVDLGEVNGRLVEIAELAA